MCTETYSYNLEIIQLRTDISEKLRSKMKTKDDQLNDYFELMERRFLRFKSNGFILKSVLHRHKFSNNVDVDYLCHSDFTGSYSRHSEFKNECNFKITNVHQN